MKKILLLLMLILGVNSIFAQKFEKIKALKTTFIADRLDLTPAEAEKFWPVYNFYEKEIHQYQVIDKMDLMQSIKEKGSIATLSDKEADEVLKKVLDIDEKIAKTEKNKYLALNKVVPTHKVLKLMRVEEGFKRELFRLLHEQKNKRD